MKIKENLHQRAAEELSLSVSLSLSLCNKFGTREKASKQL